MYLPSFLLDATIEKTQIIYPEDSKQMNIGPFFEAIESLKEEDKQCARFTTFIYHIMIIKRSAVLTITVRVVTRRIYIHI